MFDEDKKQLTVIELIALLEQMPKDMLVYIDGCDCTGEAISVEIEEFSKGDCVCIKRNP